MILAFAEHLSFLLTTHAAPGDVNSGLCGDSSMCFTWIRGHTHQIKIHTYILTIYMGVHISGRRQGRRCQQKNSSPLLTHLNLSSFFLLVAKQ